MSNIVPASRPVAASSANVSRINRYEDIQAGQYWRAKEEVPELTKPTKRKRGVYLPEDHPDYLANANMGANKIGEEDYLVDVPVRGSCPEGRMHLIKSLKMVDGSIHAVVLQNHPSESGGSGYTYLIDEFLRYFEMVDEKEAEQIRAIEIAALQAEIQELQKAIAHGPPAEGPVALLGEQTKLPAKPSVSTMISNIEHVGHLQVRAEQAVAIAQRQADWITTHTGKIAALTSGLVPFFQEKASAALASAETVLRYASDLQRGVASLGLYVGTDIEMNRLVEGESADPAEPLVVYRDLLYMDEEFLINMDQEGLENGADHENLDDFVSALKTDKSLLERIFPYPRMMVLMRYRRTNKVYFKGSTFEAALANAEYNKENKRQFLLIRDGENITQVWSELTTQEIKALYPSKAMGDANFSGIDGNLIQLDDLNFADAKGRFDDLARLYKNLLILMWGLNDREGVFGPFYNSADWTPAGFTDLAFQEKYMRFWDPYGDQTMLGRGYPSFDKWLREKNGWLRSGSRVIVMKTAIARNEKIGRNNIEAEQTGAERQIDDKAYLFIARKNKDGHVVPVDVGRQVYPRSRWKKSYYLKQSMDIVLDEEDNGYSENGGLDWLCLDMIEACEIDHYLESRIDRQKYMEFYPLLQATRDALQIEDRQLAPVIAKLKKAFEESGTDIPEGESLHSIAKNAIRLWRAAHRGAMVPAGDDDQHAAAYKMLLGNMWTLTGQNHPVKEAEQLAQDENRTPLRLVLTGKDRFALYATSVGDEIESTLFDHLWVTRIACKRKGKKLEVTSRKVMPMPDAIADEEILHQWDEVAAWKGKDVPEVLNRTGYYENEKPPYTYENIRKALAKVQTLTIEGVFERPDDFHGAIFQLNQIRRKRTKGKMVKDLAIVAPFAIIRQPAFRRIPVPGYDARYSYEMIDGGYSVLSIQDNPYRMLYRLAKDDEERKAVADAFASQYADKVYNRGQFLESIKKKPEIGCAHLADWSKAGEAPYHNDKSFNTIPLDENWSENIRQFVVARRPEAGNAISAPETKDIMIWCDDKAPAILKGFCIEHGLAPVPFVPKINRY